MPLIALEGRVRSPRLECKEKQGGGGDLEVRFRVDVDAGDPIEDVEALAEVAGRDAVITITEKHPNLKLDFAGLRPIEDRILEVCQRLDGMRVTLEGLDADDPVVPDTPTLLLIRDGLGELRELLMPTPPEVVEPTVRCPVCGREDHVEGDTLPMCGGECSGTMLPIDAKCGTCGKWKDPAWGGDGTCTARKGEPDEEQVFAADSLACPSYEVPTDACPTCEGTGKLEAAGVDGEGKATKEEVECTDCQGTGHVPPKAPRESTPAPESEAVTPEVCPKCNGAGHVPEDEADPTSLKPCDECGGSGKPKAGQTPEALGENQDAAEGNEEGEEAGSDEAGQ